ncbi:MAG: TIGR02466 family protein [Pseudomonadota bacterium]
MEENLTYLFPTPLWRVLVGDSSLNKSLRAAIYDVARNDTNFDATKYPFGYTSYISGLLLHHDVRFKEVTQKILVECKKFLLALQIKKQVNNARLGLRVNDLFCNINKKYSFHGPHRHERSDISAVYYVDVGTESSAFVAHNPAEPLFMHTQLDFFEADSPLVKDQHIIQPATGELLIFPSWMMHEVKQQQSDQERISIALNLEIIEQPIQE